MSRIKVVLAACLSAVFLGVGLPGSVTAEMSEDELQDAYHRAIVAAMSNTPAVCGSVSESVAGLPSTSVRVEAPGLEPNRLRPETPHAQNTTLTAMVEAFNERATEDPTGKDQPPLTADEVVAAIRGWIREFGPEVTDETYARYQEIAETGHVPPGTWLSTTTRWHGFRGFVFQVWWIDLEIMNDEGYTAYTFRLRDRKIASRPLTNTEAAERDEEQNRIKNKLREISPEAYEHYYGDEAENVSLETGSTDETSAAGSSSI